ncbi:MAG: hypothetical protein K0S53_3222 [Bacteroidetes bacterium]|jgi:uncharacterized membrane protein|nr:hypothetical protein [Bacteroidota bacterium]
MKTTLDKNDKIWEAVSITLLLINMLLIAFTLPSLPDTVPIHFNFAGKADGWGNKHMLWLVFVVMLPIYAIFTYLSFNPGFYRSRMTEKNLEEQYRITSKMARTVKAFILLAFVFLTLFVLKSAQGLWQEQIPFLFLIFFGLIIPPCLYYAVKISRIQ